MKKEVKARLSAAIETFSYLLLAAPDLPADDATTLEEEFSGLRKDMVEVGARLDLWYRPGYVAIDISSNGDETELAGFFTPYSERGEVSYEVDA